METWQIFALIAVIVVVGRLAWLIYARQRSSRLRSHFGPEYNRTVAEVGNRRRAESVLADREARLNQLEIHSLSRADEEKFLADWKASQARFVDDPVRAVSDADNLVI